MHVGITGASGFVGAALGEECRRRGWTVTAFSRREGAAVPGAEETRPLAGDGPVDLGGLDALVNLAGEPIAALWTRRRKELIRTSRVGLATRLVESMEQLPEEERPRVFVSASATGYYGDRGDESLDEHSDPGFGFLAAVCRDWEAAAAPAAELGVRVVAPRIGLVLGRGGLLGRVRPLFRLGLGGPLATGRQWMPWIHLADLAAILAECVGNEAVRGPVNAVAPHPVRNRDFTAAYARVLRRPALLPAPGPVLRRLPGGMGELFLASQRAEPLVMAAFGHTWRHPELEPALQAIEQELPPR